MRSGSNSFAGATAIDAGTLALPIEVPNIKNDALQIASVVLGFDGPPREAAMRADSIAALLPFQPTTTRTFAATDTLRVFAPLFWGGLVAVGLVIPLILDFVGHRVRVLAPIAAVLVLVGGFILRYVVLMSIQA